MTKREAPRQKAIRLSPHDKQRARQAIVNAAYLGARRLALNPDALTQLALRDALRPIWRGGAGRLSGIGRATARLDVRAVGGVNGLAIWIVAATLDARAPHGVKTSADPVLLIL